MGTCIHCNKEITLRDKEILCPNCNKIPFRCWNCQEKVPIEHDVCDVCGWYICPGCYACATNCRLSEIGKDLRDMKTKNPDQWSLPFIVRYIFSIKSGKKHLKCGRGVPITYAKTHIQSLMKRMGGQATKSYSDIQAFKERIDKIILKEQNEQWYINDLRKDGEFGHEDRVASNSLICRGQVEIKEIKEEKTDKIYRKYERCNIEECPFIHEQFNKDEKIKSSIDWCQKKRNDFVVVKNE